MQTLGGSSDGNFLLMYILGESMLWFKCLFPCCPYGGAPGSQSQPGLPLVVVAFAERGNGICGEKWKGEVDESSTFQSLAIISVKA